MAGSLSEIKGKIVSTQKTSHITGAMQMVSAAKLTKSEQAAKDFQIYASKIRQLIQLTRRQYLLSILTNPTFWF